MIYSLKDLSQPIVRFELEEFETVQLGFFTRLENDQVAFSLKSQGFHYEILYNKDDGPINYEGSHSYSIEEDPRIKKRKILEDKDNSRLKNVKTDPQHININIGQQNFIQSYYVQNTGLIQMIYPIVPKATEISHFQKVKESILQKEGLIDFKAGNEIFVLYFNNQLQYVERDLNILKFLQDNIKFQYNKKAAISRYEQIIFTKNIVIALNCFNVVDMYFISQNQIMPSLDQYQRQIQNKNQFLQKIFENFDWKTNQSVHQDNYYMDTQREKNNDFQKYNWKNLMNNQYIDNYYIDSKRKGVMTTHNKAFIMNSDCAMSQFEFDSNFLIINLGPRFYSKEYGPFHLLKLFADDIKSVKLLKYHVTENAAIFFFLHRQKAKNDKDSRLFNNEELSGVIFFVVIDLNKILNQNQLSVLKKNQIIFIPINLKHIVKDKFNKHITKYESASKIQAYTSNDMEFEMVRDINEPTKEFFPFIFHNWVAQKDNSEYFEHYLCFLNIEEMI